MLEFLTPIHLAKWNPVEWWLPFVWLLTGRLQLSDIIGRLQRGSLR